MTNLFLCSIGPVQEFIATARRSRDLQYGSWMLSELSKAGAKALADKYGIGSLVFPAPKTPTDLDPKSNLNVANKILAIIEGDPADAGEIVLQGVRRRLDALQKEAFQHVQNAPFDGELAEKQVSDLPEFYWVSVPYEDEKQYVQSRHTAESLLAARKNTRNFRQFQGKMRPKSSLDASREAVIPEEAYPNWRHDSEATIQRKIRNLYNRYGARRGERLSGVDLLKRLGSKGQSFPSTSELAAQPFLQGLDNEAAENLLKSLEMWFTDCEIQIDEKNSVLLYPGRAAEYLNKPELQEEYEQALERALSLYAKDRHPGAYYALLIADGDGMGARLNQMQNPEMHRRFSQSLSAFAEQAKAIIKKHQGTPIYVGGDDIMAYFPLHTALACLQELETVFRSIADVQSTLSGGLVIAHHLTPLSEVLKLARAAEKEAKGVPGKNGLCIVLNKRSGVARQIVDHWPDLNARLNVLTGYCRAKIISNGTAYELQRMYHTLDKADLPPDALSQESLRIIQRKRESGGERDLPPDVRQKLHKWLKDDGLRVDELAMEMVVAVEFAAAQDMAKLPLNPVQGKEKEDGIS